MTNRVFLDSNIWVYFFSDNENHKARVVEKYLADNALRSIFITSCQVVNEVSNGHCCLKFKKTRNKAFARN